MSLCKWACVWLALCVVNQSVVSGVTTTYNREQLWLANESLIAKLQAGCRGYLVRKGLKERKDFLKSQDPAITTIQVRGQTLPFLWTWSESIFPWFLTSFLLISFSTSFLLISFSKSIGAVDLRFLPSDLLLQYALRRMRGGASNQGNKIEIHP